MGGVRPARQAAEDLRVIREKLHERLMAMTKAQCTEPVLQAEQPESAGPTAPWRCCA